MTFIPPSFYTSYTNIVLRVYKKFPAVKILYCVLFLKKKNVDKLSGFSFSTVPVIVYRNWRDFLLANNRTQLILAVYSSNDSVASFKGKRVQFTVNKLAVIGLGCLMLL